MAAPAPTPWPVSFTMNVTTNLSLVLAAVVLPADQPQSPVRAQLAYDWGQHAQRVDHAAGALECQQFYGWHGPCSLIFRPDGMYRILHATASARPAEGCCLDLPGIGSVPPDWASGATFAGFWPVPHTGGEARLFEWPGTRVGADCLPGLRMAGSVAGHTYFEWPDGQPALFTFPANRGLQDWYFDRGTMRTAKQLPTTLFALPHGCARRRCEQGTPLMAA